MKKNKKTFSFEGLLRNIVKYFRNIYKKFMSIPQKWRLVMLVWGIILIFLIIFIIVGSANKNRLQKYEAIESKITEVTEDYLKKNSLYPSEMKPLVLSTEAMLDNELITDDLFEGKTCVGYSKSYYSDIDEKYKIKVYLNCSDYTTDGYSSNK